LDSERELSFADTHDRDWLFEVPEVRAVVRPTILEDCNGNEQDGTYIAVELGPLYNVGQLLDNTSKTPTHTVKDEWTVTGQSVHVTCGYGASSTRQFQDRLRAQMDVILHACFGDRGDQNPLLLSSRFNALRKLRKPKRWCIRASTLDPSIREGDILLGDDPAIRTDISGISEERLQYFLDNNLIDFSLEHLPTGCTHEGELKRKRLRDATRFDRLRKVTKAHPEWRAWPSARFACFGYSPQIANRMDHEHGFTLNPRAAELTEACEWINDLLWYDHQFGLRYWHEESLVIRDDIEYNPRFHRLLNKGSWHVSPPFSEFLERSWQIMACRKSVELAENARKPILLSEDQKSNHRNALLTIPDSQHRGSVTVLPLPPRRPAP
jgi:hypothetical protein